MHKNWVKTERMVLEISSRTDREIHRQKYSSQYFVTAPVGEVIKQLLFTPVKNHEQRRTLNTFGREHPMRGNKYVDWKGNISVVINVQHH